MPNWMFNQFFDYRKILAKLLLILIGNEDESILVLIQTYHHLTQMRV